MKVLLEIALHLWTCERVALQCSSSVQLQLSSSYAPAYMLCIQSPIPFVKPNYPDMTTSCKSFAAYVEKIYYIARSKYIYVYMCVWVWRCVRVCVSAAETTTTYISAISKLHISIVKCKSYKMEESVSVSASLTVAVSSSVSGLREFVPESARPQNCLVALTSGKCEVYE